MILTDGQAQNGHTEAGNMAYEPVQLSMKIEVFGFIRLKRPVPEYAESEIERNPIGICD